MKKRVMLLLLAATMGLAMMGCQSSDGGDGDKASESNKSQTEENGTSGSNLEGTVTLAAAASLEYAFEEELIPAFEEQYPDVTSKVSMILPESCSSRSSPVLRQISFSQQRRRR